MNNYASIPVEIESCHLIRLGAYTITCDCA